MWIHVSVEQSPKEVENEVLENFNFTLIYFVYTEVCIQFDIYYFERRMKRMKKNATTVATFIQVMYANSAQLYVKKIENYCAKYLA